MADVNEGVQEFYTGQSILLTGATGFLGRTIIEKLLRTCPKIKRLFLLIRDKKEKDSHQRLDDLFDDAVFSRMKEENPNYLEKVTLIPGEISLPSNGISSSNRKKLIQEVTIVFHVAATVRFDEYLKTAVLINVYGTKELLQFSSECCNLKAFIHVSTAFSNCDKNDIVREEVYKPPIQGNDLIKLVNCLPLDELEICSRKITRGWPNNYSFSKQVAEDLVRSEAVRKKIPAAIFRPAIVIGANSEPIPGWIDNIYGPTGVTAAVAAGVLRVMHANGNTRAELVPVDMTVNAVLAVAWDLANSYRRNESKGVYTSRNTIPVYNYASSKMNSITWNDYRKYNFQHGLTFPTMNSLWYYSMTLTNHLTLFYLISFFLHILPAIMVDTFLLISGKKPQALKVYRKLHKFLVALSYFSVGDWDFYTNNTSKVWNRLSVTDKELFNFDMDSIDWDRYFENFVKSIRIFILKDTSCTFSAARRKFFWFYILHRLVQIIFVSTTVWLSWLLSKSFVY